MPNKSRKIKKNKIINKGGKRSGNATALLSFKGEVVRVARTHGFIRQLDSEKSKSKSAESAKSATEYFISGRNLLGAIPGDVVLCEKVKPMKDRKCEGEKLQEAKVVKILEASDNLLTGTIVVNGNNGRLYLNPDSFGSREPLEIGSWGGYKLKGGDKVSFSLELRDVKHHLHIAGITGVYGSSQSANVCVTAYLDEKKIAVVFPQEVSEEAEACGDVIDTAEIPHRLDLRDCPIFTIDGSDTKDIDDAISIEHTKSGFRLGVHIADVSHYVTADSALDGEALKRGTSVYIADLVVPMLPKALSNGICSLNPGVDRFAFSCIMEVLKSGELKSFAFNKTVIRSRIQGVYSEINEIIEGRTTPELSDKYTEVISQIPIMVELATILKKNREGRNAPALESDEGKIICGAHGECLDIKRRNSGVSEGIIEEFMLLANNAAARLAMENELPFVYRVHEPPAAEKLTRLSETLAGLGISVPDLKPTAESLSKVLKAVQNESLVQVVNMAVLRSMMKAKYFDEPLGHFGLVMSEYAHFTSPIRRYPDLSIHRILTDFVKPEQKSKIVKKYGKFAYESAFKSTNAELKAVTAERDCNKFYYAEYMSERIDVAFDGTVSGVTDTSVFIMLENTVEGRVSFADYSDASGYKSDGVSLSNSVTGVKYTLGDKVKVKCVRCNIPLGMVDFEIIDLSRNSE